MADARREPFVLGDVAVPAGQRRTVELELARLPTAQAFPLSAIVLHGARPGPGLWLSAAIHGDELNGVEIIRRVLQSLDPARLRGTLIAVPVVNAFGFLQRSRYLPDRRDLNRCFPGSSNGSLASQLAHLFLTEIVDRCDYGIDLHTAGDGRVNLPQVLADLDEPETMGAALAFGAPAVVHARMRDGSLRAAATERGKRVLLYEGGEPLRYTEEAIAAGVRGVRAVMGMAGLTRRIRQRATTEPLMVRRTTWLRAPRAGLARLAVTLGSRVVEGQTLAEVTGPHGEHERVLRAPEAGLVLGLATNPVVFQGDALVHLARTSAALD